MRGFLGAAIRSFSGHILGALSALIAAYSVTATLTVSQSGLFFLGLGFAIFFSHFLRFGLDNFVLKKCAIYLSDGNHGLFLSIVAASALLAIAGGVGVYLLLYASEAVVPYEHMALLLQAFPAAIAAALLGVIAHTLHASGFVFSGSITNNSLHYLIFSVLVWIIDPSSATESILLYAIASYSSLFIQCTLALFLYKYKGIAFSTWSEVHLLKVDYREIFSTTLPLWMVVIAQQLNMWGSQFISSVYVDEAELALLAIAMRISMLVPMILTAVNMVVSPKFAAHFHNGEIAETEDVLAQSLKVLAAVSLLIFAFMVFFGDDVLAVFGEQYVAAASLLVILACGQLLNAMTGPCGKLLMMSGFEKDIRNFSMLVAACGIALAFVLTSRFGVRGAAVATALTISIQNITLACLVNHRLKISLIRIYSNFFGRQPQKSL